MDEAAKRPNKAQIAILSIMKKVDFIGNDTSIKGANIQYRAVSEGAVLAKIRPLFLEEGLIYYPIEGTLTSSGPVSYIAAKYRITHVESGDYFDIWSAGAGHDKGDKGPGKALTYSGKYGLMKLTMIRGEEDPDSRGTEDIVKEENALDFAYNQAINKAKDLFDARLYDKAAYDHIIKVSFELKQNKDAIKRFKDEMIWLGEIERKERVFSLEAEK